MVSPSHPLQVAKKRQLKNLYHHERGKQMSRLSVLPEDQLTPELSALAEQAESLHIPATVFQVFGHCPELFQSFLQFYFPWHERGVVPPVIKELVRLRIAQLNKCVT